jgi:hypothetical protein
MGFAPNLFPDGNEVGFCVFIVDLVWLWMGFAPNLFPDGNEVGFCVFILRDLLPDWWSE